MNFKTLRELSHDLPKEVYKKHVERYEQIVREYFNTFEAKNARGEAK